MSQVPRQQALAWVYQFFPYLQTEFLSETEFTNSDLTAFCVITQYEPFIYEVEDIYIRLKAKNEESRKREEEAAAAAAAAAVKVGREKQRRDYSESFHSKYGQYYQYSQQLQQVQQYPDLTLANSNMNQANYASQSQKYVLKNNVQSKDQLIKLSLEQMKQNNYPKLKQTLIPFISNNRQQCETLIKLIIEKAWTEPKFITVCSKLLREFAELKQYKQKQTKNTSINKHPFKDNLISFIQFLFLNKFKEDYSLPIENQWQLSRNKVIGIVSLVGLLLIQKVLTRKIVNQCIGDLLTYFFLAYSKQDSIKYFNLVETYFEGIIALIYRIGNYFQIQQDHPSAESFQKVLKLIETTSKKAIPLKGVTGKDWNISSQNFFKIFDLIDRIILSKEYPRMSQLLGILTKTRKNNWLLSATSYEKQQHTTNLQLNTSHQKLISQQNKSSFDYKKIWKNIFVNYETKNSKMNQSNTQKDLEMLFEQDPYKVISTYIRMFADGKQKSVKKRVDIFRMALKLNMIKSDHLLKGWLRNAGKLCYSKLPFASKYFVQLMKMMNDFDPIIIQDWEIVNSDDEQETKYAVDVIEKYKRENSQQSNWFQSEQEE